MKNKTAISICVFLVALAIGADTPHKAREVSGTDSLDLVIQTKALPVGRFQLVTAQVPDDSGIMRSTLFRLDTATGDTCRYEVEILESSNRYFVEGWVPIGDFSSSFLKAITSSAQPHAPAKNADPGAKEP